jgi:hypothetical protein
MVADETFSLKSALSLQEAKSKEHWSNQRKLNRAKFTHHQQKLNPLYFFKSELKQLMKQAFDTCSKRNRLIFQADSLV